jgi:lysophospholipase L1-like esterase
LVTFSKRKKAILSAALLGLVWCFASLLQAQPQGVTTDSLPVKVGPYDKNVQLVGRFDMSDKTGPRCAWTGSSFVIRFKGTAVNALLNHRGGQRNWFQVVVDDSVRGAFSVVNDTLRYRAIAGLKDTIHTLMLFKRTEASIGVVQLVGFELSKNGQLLDPPAPLKRRIEMVGNSITCGYGNEAANEKSRFTPETENGYLAYGAVAARTLNAEYRAIAWSGKGMCRNIDLSTTERMYELYERTLPADTASRWDFKTWVPDVVVINLGTNDFNKGNPTEADFIGAYRSFIQRARSRYPQAHIVCSVGSMMSDGWPKGNQALTTTRDYLTRMVASFNKAGDQAVHYLEFDPQDSANGLGASYHPNLVTDRIMADKMVKSLRDIMKW